MKRVLKYLLVLTLILCPVANAHSGKTDASGGHKDNKNASGLGSYHYHCGGHPAHLHANGCPYNITVNATPSVKPVALNNTTAMAISLATTPITLNELTNEAIYAEYGYSCLIYNEIVYIPLIHDVASHMGVITTFTADDGLSISTSSCIQRGGISEISASQSTSLVEATRAPFKITLNSKVFDNSSEPYPFLLYNEITYLPLTWHIAVDELGWVYSYSNDCLVITCDR